MTRCQSVFRQDELTHAGIYRSDTLAQTETKYAWKLDTCARPAPHLGPTPPLRFSLMYTSYNAATLPLMGAGEPEPMADASCSGIDLGSDCKYFYYYYLINSKRHVFD